MNVNNDNIFLMLLQISQTIQSFLDNSIYQITQIFTQMPVIFSKHCIL